MMRGRLNAFQRTMLRFRELHPYSAVHVVDVGAPLDATRLRSTIDAELGWRGIGTLALDGAQRRYEYASAGTPAPLRVIEAAADRSSQLAAEIERELNAPFDLGGGVPMRFFAIDGRATFKLGVVYDHFVAGGDAIVGLLAGLARRYAGDPSTGAPPPLYPKAYRSLIARRPLDALRALASLPELVASARRGARPRYARDDDHYNAFTLASVDRECVARVATITRSWGVTRNDVLLAALMLAVAPFAQQRFQSPRRRELGVASIVNLRREFGPHAEQAFGQFLSSFRVSDMVAPGTDLGTLARIVHAQSSVFRRRRVYLRTIYTLALAGVVWPYLDDGKRHRVFPKHHPVWGAVTMLDVDALWPNGARRPDYVRGVSTGPLSPLVLAVTPAGGRWNLGFAFRTACYSRSDAEQIAADIVHRLDSLQS